MFQGSGKEIRSPFCSKIIEVKEVKSVFESVPTASSAEFSAAKTVAFSILRRIFAAEFLCLGWGLPKPW